MIHESDDTAGPSAPGLERRLGLATATALVVGEVVGVGIFLVPAGMARSLGSPGWLLLVWLAMGASAIGGALCLGELAARCPETGGLYVYLREAYGPRAAFLYGWLSMLVTDPGVTAMLAAGLAGYVAHLMPMPPGGIKLVAAGSIVVLAGINMAGAARGALAVRGLTGLKLALLGLIAIWGCMSDRGNWSNLAPFWGRRPGSPPIAEALASGLIGAFVAFGGWWDVSKIAGETRDPERTMPRALLLGVSIVALVYTAVSLVFLRLAPPGTTASDDAFAALAGRALFGRSGEFAFAAIVVVSVAGSLAAVLMAAPRVYYAMARDGLFFHQFAALGPRGGAPIRALAIQTALAIALVLTGTFEQILEYFMAPTLMFLGLAVLAVLPKRHGPKMIAAALLALLPIIAIIGLQTLQANGRAAIGFAVVLAGLPFAMLISPKRPSSPKNRSTAKAPGTPRKDKNEKRSDSHEPSKDFTEN